VCLSGFGDEITSGSLALSSGSADSGTGYSVQDTRYMQHGGVSLSSPLSLFHFIHFIQLIPTTIYQISKPHSVSLSLFHLFLAHSTNRSRTSIGSHLLRDAVYLIAFSFLHSSRSAINHIYFATPLNNRHKDSKSNLENQSLLATKLEGKTAAIRR
jgi:hypothetical protein